MSWITALFYFFIFGFLFRYPYIVLILILLYVFRDRIPNPADLFRRKRRIARLYRHLEVNPHDLTARRDLGMALLDSGRPADAREVLREANKKDGDSVEINHLLGLALLRSGSAGEATGYLKAAVEKEPRFRYGESHLYLAEAHLAEGRPDESLKSVREYLAINSTSIEGQYCLAKTLAALGDKKGAAQATADGIKYHKGNPSFRRRRDWRWYVRLKGVKRGL